MLTVAEARYTLTYHADGRWRIVDWRLQDFAGLAYPDGVHRPLMFASHAAGEAWLHQCAARGLDMALPSDRPRWGHVDYERWRARVG
ncbi:hypothetical protein ACWD4B_18540 [Streptomyces sp. NPDC002536]